MLKRFIDNLLYPFALQPSNIYTLNTSENRVDTDNSRQKKAVVYHGFNAWSGINDELLKVLDKCGKSLTEIDNPYEFIDFSRLMYKVFPLYAKAIELRTIFLGNLEIENINKDLRIEAVSNYVLKEIPIYSTHTLFPITRGLNSLVNYVSKNTDIYGMFFVSAIYNSNGEIIGLRLYDSSRFVFDIETQDNYSLLYVENNGKSTVIDVDAIYNFSYSYSIEYSWGTPLIYTNKFMGDNLMKLINAQMMGLLRNMNPYNMTIISTDSSLIAEGDVGLQQQVDLSIGELQKNATKAAEKSINGESVNLVASIPTKADVKTVSGATDIKFIDSKSLSLLIEIFCAGLGVQYPLMMNASGSMNTDQTKTAVTMLDAWAVQFGRPQMLPNFEKLTKDIFMSKKIPVTDKDIKVLFKGNESVLAAAGVKTSAPAAP